MRVHAVLTCFNRRSKTKRCLTALYRQVPDDSVSVCAYVVDDGSTDGTSEMLRACFPQAEVIQGTGNLYWCGGMRVAWRAAARADPDYFLLLNDDTTLDSHALAVLIATAGPPESRRIAVGAIRDPESGALTYGGVKDALGNFPPRGAAEPCDTFNGNAVLIPRAVFRETGIFSEAYTHGMADYDYGFQARKLGMEIVQTPSFVGTCARNSLVGSWRDCSLSRLERLRLLRSPKGLPLREWVIYNRRNAGWRWPVRSVSPFIRVLLGL